MLVTKTINNNIVACTSPEGKEMIAMGRGLGFDYKAGADVPVERIEKVFAIEEKSGYDNLKNLFSNIPEDLLNICISIIDEAKNMLNVQLNDTIYLTLTDHINFAISKHHEGIDACSALAGEVKVFYAREYLIGKNALQLIETKLGVTLPEGEACAIALHIVNAEYNTDIGSILRITEKISDVLTIIRRNTGLEVEDDNVAGASFISFLKFFVFRVSTPNGMIETLDDNFPSMMERFRPDLFALADKIGRHLFKGTDERLSRMDKAILASNIYSYEKYKKRS